MAADCPRRAHTASMNIPLRHDTGHTRHMMIIRGTDMNTVMMPHGIPMYTKARRYDSYDILEGDSVQHVRLFQISMRAESLIGTGT